MRRFTTAMLVAFVLVLGCETTNKTTTNKTTTQSQLYTFSKGITALNKRDTAALTAYYADDVTFVTAGEAFTGTAGVKTHWDNIFLGFSEIKFQPQLTLVSDDDLVSIILVTGTHKEFWMGEKGHTHVNPNTMVKEEPVPEEEMAPEEETPEEGETEGTNGAEEGEESAEKTDDMIEKKVEPEVPMAPSFPAAPMAVYVAIHQVYKDGKIVKEHAYFNPAITLSQLGAMGDMPAATLEKPWEKRSAVLGTGSSAEQLNTARTKMLVQATNDRDARLASSVYDIDIEMNGRFFVQQSATGRDAAVKAFKGMLASSSNMKQTTEHFVAAGDWVATVSHYTGVNDGPMPDGIEATNKGYDIKIIGFNRFENGKIVEEWGFGNGMELLAQLELLGKPGDMADAEDKK